MGPGCIVSSNLEKDVNVIGNFVFAFNLIILTSGVHLILFSNLICNHLRADGTHKISPGSKCPLAQTRLIKIPAS